jgi:para-aminobenzoate synthetase component 1
MCGHHPSSQWPNAEFVWCESALIHDAENDSWWSIGDCEVPAILPMQEQEKAWGDLEDTTSSETFANAVKRTVEYIHAGDIFQANITRRYSATVDGNLRMNALQMLGDPGGWYGAWLEFPDEGRYVLSMSPELFMQFNEDTRAIVTRPMKGTRPDGDAPEVLLDSSKDAAELHMIVDLMRNDLGRVCAFGSLRVQEARALERHPTVWQCVGEVHGQVRKELSIVDVLQATFPPGSVTGAPKIRAMQIIKELEDTPRGPYCGAIGIIGKIAMLNVAIRTALFQGSGTPSNFKGTMEYSTGCGIVAESDPQAETEESEVKTRIMKC